jgi:hypothetical protein
MSRGGQGLGEVAADPVGVPGPDVLEPAAPGRGEGDVEAAAVGGADGPGDEPVAFHAVQQPGDAAAAERVGDDHGAGQLVQRERPGRRPGQVDQHVELLQAQPYR